MLEKLNMHHKLKILILVACNALTIHSQGQFNLIQPTKITGAFMEYDRPEIAWDMSGKVQLYLNNGITLLEGGKFNQAIFSFEEALELDPQLWIAYFYQGVCFKLIDNLSDAEVSLLRSLKIKPDSQESLLEMGKILALQDRVGESSDYFSQAIAVSKNKSEIYYLLGNLNLITKRVSEARTYYNKALNLQSDLLDAQIGLSIITWLIDNDAKTASSDLDKILEVDSLHNDALYLKTMLSFEERPKQSLFYSNRLVVYNPQILYYRYIRGLIYSKLENFDLAIADFRKVMLAYREDENQFIGQQTFLDRKIDFQYADYYMTATAYGLPTKELRGIQKSYCLMITRQYDEGIKTLNSINNHKKSALCQYLLAIAFEHTDRHDQAFKSYGKALSYDPDILDALKKRGIYYTNFEKWQLAVNDFNRVVELDPQNLFIYKLRGVARYYLNDFSGAIQDFSRCLDNDTTDCEARKSRAMSYEKQGDFKNAVADMLRCPSGKGFKEYVPIISHLVEKGDTTKALELIQDILVENPTIEALIYKAELLINQKDWVDAMSIVNQAIEKMKHSQDNYTSSNLLTLKGIIQLNTGNLEEAKANLSLAITKSQFNGRAYLERGKVFQKQGQKEAAISDLTRAVEFGYEDAKVILKEARN